MQLSSQVLIEGREFTLDRRGWGGEDPPSGGKNLHIIPSDAKTNVTIVYLIHLLLVGPAASGSLSHRQEHNFRMVGSRVSGDTHMEEESKCMDSGKGMEAQSEGHRSKGCTVELRRRQELCSPQRGLFHEGQVSPGLHSLHTNSLIDDLKQVSTL